MFDRILVPLDGSALAECVLPHAQTLAQVYDAQLILLQVTQATLPERQPVDPLSWRLRRAEAQAYLEDVAGRLQDRGIRADLAVQEGQLAVRVVDFIRKQDIPLILLSSHGRDGLSGWSTSSNTLEVALRVHISMMIVPAYRPAPEVQAELRYRRLLLPLDGSRRAECVLPLANAIAGLNQLELLAVHVVSAPQLPGRLASTHDAEQIDSFTERARNAASAYMEQLSSRLHGNVQYRLLADDQVSTTLQRMAAEEDLDLLLLSAHGHGGNNRWPFGSVALHFIIYGVPCPLLVVQDFQPHEIVPTPSQRVITERKGH